MDYNNSLCFSRLRNLNSTLSIQISNYTTTLIVTISICFLLLVSNIIFCYLYYVKRKKGKEGKDKFFDGNVAMINSSMPLNDQAEHLSYDGKREIDRSKFTVGQKLGGGCFGCVYEGMVEDFTNPGQKMKVAVKTVKNRLDPAQIFALMCEIKVLDKLDFHLNLVNMIGACTDEFRNGELWLLLEHCSHGNMKNFLLRNRDIILKSLHYHRVPHEILNIRLFLKWSHSICRGMEYLASKNIMHGDLAARNILISKSNNCECYVAKISDFGLSKIFYDKTSYVKQERKKLPWKWMDVYFLDTNVLRLSSDVWSFGIVFWEMLSLGRFPYAGEEADVTIKKIKDGFRLPVPDEVEGANWLVNIYNEVTNMCWQLDPEKRCNFSDLVKIFNTLLTTEEKEKYIILEQNFAKNEAKLGTYNAFSKSMMNHCTHSCTALPCKTLLSPMYNMHDIELIYSNPIDETFEMEHIDP